MIDYSKFDTAIGLNWYETDPNLQLLMRRLIPPSDFKWCETWLKKWGALCGGPIAERAEITDKNPPRLVKFDRNGEEINEVVHHSSALETKRDLWNAGFNGLPWSPEARELGKPVPAALMLAFSYLLSQAETGMLCSIGMTDGVADLVEKYGDDRVKAEYLPRLRSMNYDQAWDGSMFLTEKTGGSDLGVLTTTARKRGDIWLLTGLKWFCSNVDGRAIVTLARPEGAPDGIKGIGLFLVPKFKRDGTRNGIHIRRIKDKLGTRAVPTAEVDFVDAEAYGLQGTSKNPADKGINRMMEMVNLSRLGVAAMGAGIARRSFLEAAIYASKRDAFGRRLTQWPMMQQDLLRLQSESESAASMLFECARVGDKARNEGDEDAAGYLRILVPLTKIRATRQGLECASRGLEVMGGNGYIEDWPMARQLRDAQCHTLWEGTDNILSLDVLRSMAKNMAHEPLLRRVDEILSVSKRPGLEDIHTAVSRQQHRAKRVLGELSSGDPETAVGFAKIASETMCDALQSALLLEEAAADLDLNKSQRKARIARVYLANRHGSGETDVPASPKTSAQTFDEVFQYG